ncbi:LytTR family transcriptional regulator [Sphingobacterium sp. PCS056]|uniref:LytTR family DNA-binding domain-containing protein n=1 Tax=Sphingobacterium sp. PCS056 TaxID=2931400 RepID=UPI0020101A8A|nr:LytTR family DNA-binding domain-containing protein [Sphingobacterium sp. PCS056]UPZ35722.1 LytTR family transcriptional regulator [Sphingobacterium sp. PCS056]
MILRAQYPNSETSREIIVTSSIVGILLYFSIIIYQPFGTSQFEHSYKYLLLFPYAIITAFSFCSVNLLISKQKRKWTIGLELFKTFLILVVISFFSYLYNTLFLSQVYLSFENFLYMFVYTSALGFPVVLIYILARYIYLNNKNKPAISNMITANKPFIKQENFIQIDDCTIKLCIVADSANSTLEIAEQDFVYAESADNYCILYFYENGIIQTKFIRISLTKLLDQIQTDTIKKVHRSFIVNLKKVTKFKGNASGYKISIENIDKELSISRNYIYLILPVLKNIAVRP